MSPFAQMVDPTASLTLIAPSAKVPASAARFAGEPVRWVAIQGATAASSFARCALRIFTGASNGIPGNSASAWTLLELAPLPGFATKTFLALAGGLPVQYVLLSPQASTTQTDNTVVAAGEVVTTPSAVGTSVWFGMCFQDRVVRDPALWSAQIGTALLAAGADATAWTPFAQRLAALQPSGLIYVLDHTGRPLGPAMTPYPDAPQTFSITTASGTTTVSLTSASDGNTGVVLAAGDRATVSFTTAAHPVVASAETESGAFEGGYQLAPGERHVQVTDAVTWFADRDNLGVTLLARWNPNSFLEPIVDGNPYFARLVSDLRSTKGSGGGVGLAGWAFVKESLLDSTMTWPLIPGQNDTTFVPLVKELVANGSQVRLLVNQFLQFEGGTFDDSEAALALVWALFAATFPLAAFRVMATDPAGFGVLLGAIGVATFLLDSPLTLDVLRAIGEASTGTVKDLQAISTDLSRWSPYPATTSDNPFYTPPLKFVDITIDDIIHFGVYHQKFVVGKTGTAGEYFGYLGGIDINSDRIDSQLHRALFPFHDVQARITGPATKDLIQSFAERAVHDGLTLPFEVPATPPTLPVSEGKHLVQIGRTYFAPKVTPGFTFAPNGETVTHRSNIQAIKAARDFIYIEEQYFTPNDEYVDALIGAAQKAQSLIITVCMQNGQIFGPTRRTDILNKLSAVWGTNMKVGAPIRRFLNPTPAKTVNLGRCYLTDAITPSSTTISIAPKSHIPDPPFWVFVENELMQVTASQPDTDPAKRTLYVNRGPEGTVNSWGAKVDKHDEKSAVMCVRVPHIYVHAKLMIIDDVFLSVGSANLNRRGHFHDGELNGLVIPQHLKHDPSNPARVLRSRLWAEHMGLSPEMGLSLFTDPLSALPYFDRGWFAGNRWQPLAWTGVETDTESPFSSSDSIATELLKLAVGIGEEAYESTIWPLLVDPTCVSDPNSDKPGPQYPS